MATWYLVNSIRARTSQLFAGILLDDVRDPARVALVRQVGGLLWPSSDAAVAAAAALAQAARRGGQGADVCDSLMNAAIQGRAAQSSTTAVVNNVNAPYTMQATDDTALVDNSDAGEVLVVKFPAAPTPGMRKTVKWWKSQVVPAGSATVDGNGNNVESWSASTGQSSIGATASINQIGGQGTWEWNSALSAWVLVA